MCLIVLARAVHPEYPLLLVANRDEYYRRPTAAAHWWQHSSGILAGRDLQAGGTWLGIADTGRWAAVTNFREGTAPPAARSRGALTTGFLRGDASPADYADRLAPAADLYNGYNLLLGTPRTLLFTSNRGGSQAVGPGIHTLSNHSLNTPWPKSRLVAQKLAALLESGVGPAPEVLMRLLQDRSPFADHLLPSTGLDLARERALSPPFIVSGDYGTRSTTVLLWHRSGRVTLVERTFGPGGQEAGTQEFGFRVRRAAPEG